MSLSQKLKEFVSDLTGQARYEKKYDAHGNEVMDGTPFAVPIHLKRPPTLQEQVSRLVRSEAMRMEAARLGRESFEEAEDFDVDDDLDPRSPYEVNFDPAEQKKDFERYKTMKEEYPDEAKKGRKRISEKAKAPSAGQGSKEGASPSDDSPNDDSDE